MTYIISLVSAVIGASITLLYSSHISKRQERAIMLVFAQEFITLFNRCSMYYHQMLKGAISTSALCEISDSATLTKLAELTNDAKIIETIINLKTWFFQVIRHAERASAELPSGNTEKAADHQKRAMAFFMGDPFTKSGQFDRCRYKNYLSSIRMILDQLEKLNSPSAFRALLVHLIPTDRRHALAVDRFVVEARQTLNKRGEELENLRKQEAQRLQQAEKGGRA